jgi:esterase/lipase superfamily enzyme
MKKAKYRGPNLAKQAGASLYKVCNDSCPGRLAVFALLMVALHGCAGRPGPETLNPVADHEGRGKLVTVMSVTDRDFSGRGGRSTGVDRGKPRYEQFTFRMADASIGKPVASAKSVAADPSKGFVVVDRKDFAPKAFMESKAMKDQPGNAVVVFVHGYNYSYQEAVFRMAQLASGVGPNATPILFSWPSQASFSGYVADRDSATYARDDLVELLTSLSHSDPKRKITLLGHSMGGWLVMEALRQLRLQGRDDVIARLQVGLAAPDIDMDVFRAQASVVGRLSPPLTILVSPDDRALAISSRVSGGRPRVGAAGIGDAELQTVARNNGMRLFDISALPSNDEFNHNRFFTFAALYASRADDQRLAGGVRRAGAYMLEGTGKILAIPFTGAAYLVAETPR